MKPDARFTHKNVKLSLRCKMRKSKKLALYNPDGLRPYERVPREMWKFDRGDPLFLCKLIKISSIRAVCKLMQRESCVISGAGASSASAV